MAASCYALCGRFSGAEIWLAIPKCRATWGRNQWVELASGARALFDGYNANPESMAAAIENVARLSVSGRKFAFLGEMLEMGELAGSAHEELGRLVAAGGFDGVAFIGASRDSFAAGLQAGGFRKTVVISKSYENDVAVQFASVLQAGDIVLIKGSRGVHLEEVLRDFGPLNFAGKG